MKSIFDLKTKNSDLVSANQGLTNYKYSEIQSLKSISGTNFPQGQITYRWTYGNQTWWVPNKSYLRISCRLSKFDGTPLNANDKIALNMNAAPHLFQTAQFKIADMTVSAITQHLAQVDTLKTRQNQSRQWLETVGKATNNWAPSFYERANRNGGVELDLNHTEPFLTFETLSANPGAGFQGLTANPTDITKTADGFHRFQFNTGITTGANFILQKGDYISVKVGALDDYYIGQLMDWDLNLNTIDLRFNSSVVNAVNMIGGGQPVITFESAFVGRNHFGKSSDNIMNFDLIWKPTLSVFDLEHALPCAGTAQELNLTPWPEGNYQKQIIQSLGIDADLAADFNFEVSDMRLFLLTCDSNPIQNNMEFMLDLREIQCNKSIISSTNQQTSVDVIGSCNGITIAFQDQATAENTVYPASLFTIREHLETKLQRYYIRYSGQVPQPDFEGELEKYNISADQLNSKNGLLDIYNRSNLYTGQHFNVGGAETWEEFMERGLYIYHPFPKTASSRNTRVFTQTQFSTLTTKDNTLTNPALCLFQHYLKVVVISVVNGRIVNVLPIDA